MNVVCRLLLAVLPLLLSGLLPLQAQEPRISEWVETAPVSDNTKIALGYPVPIPVDTPLPFAGFRTYAGLHARHQDLAATTPWVHAKEVGATYNGRTIWAYQLGDADLTTPDGMREHAMLSNGGIHAREWQSPEVATGIIELIALSEGDDFLVAYLRDNANIVVIPVLNIDGFLQTQRFPRRDWMGTDPGDPEYSPRDGRMRRKNMLGADEDLLTQDDHLQGVDLNRNNPPFWADNPDRSSPDPRSIVHHGASAHSEPETQALAAAAGLGPADKLSMYTDMHSFSQVHFWGRSDSDRLANLTQSLLQAFSNHHQAFPAGKWYHFSSAFNVPRNQGIGTTEEYFLHQYEVPSWTLEIEPSSGSHPGLPGQGADYGGLGRNGHDGFILPDSEVERVRTQLAQSFAVAYYRQSGPPAMAAFRLVDKATSAIVYDAEWQAVDEKTRQLHTFQAQPLQLGREYSAWIAWDKPLRWREDGQVTTMPGQPPLTLNFERNTLVGDSPLNSALGDEQWMDRPGGASAGYRRYRDDAVAYDFSYPDDDSNRGLVDGTVTATFDAGIYDMTGYRGDADPSTSVVWENGGWSGYENTEGFDQTDSGGRDRSIRFQVTSTDAGDPFVIEPGITAAWYDPDRNGEGFLVEILPDDRAVMYWFTYDSDGNQDWYVATGSIVGNHISFPELIRVSGGEFGPGFDPEKVERTVVGSAEFTWSSCESGVMKWVLDNDGAEPRQGGMELRRLSHLMSLSCGLPQPLPPERPEGQLSGSWYDPTHDGEGYVVEVLIDSRVLVYWYSFDPEGNRRWFFGIGEIREGKFQFDEMLTTSGGVFGPDFDPDEVQLSPWGSLELELGCTEGTARFVPLEEGFPAGALDLTRLTAPDGLSCGP